MVAGRRMWTHPDGIVTEAEWLGCEAAMDFVDFFTNYAPDAVGSRKFYLFGAACCRRVQHVLTSDALHSAIEAAEQFADGAIAADRLQAVGSGAFEAHLAVVEPWVMTRVGFEKPTDPIYYASMVAMQVVSLRITEIGGGLRSIAKYVPYVPAFQSGARYLSDQWRAAWLVESRELVKLFRDIFGNPFRSVAFAPAWQTETAVGLARGIYADRAFDRMPVLADALEEAGCAEPAVLDHCRGPGEHVRGCWVVDLVLGLEEPPRLDPTGERPA